MYTIDPAGEKPSGQGSRIAALTALLNRDNVSRTRAYQAFWRRHPEVHWALLAAFVSRNAGYLMSDLAVDGAFRAADRGLRSALFEVLERCNWLIFQDAFPQLLLYHLSKATGRPLFGEIRQVTSSGHMQPVWSRFWETQDSDALTRALIANEQAYVHNRVVTAPKYASVFSNARFRMADRLGMTFLLLPRLRPGARNRLATVRFRVRDFHKLESRVRLGVRIYEALFPGGALHHEIRHWIDLHRHHTGSRRDYVPHAFVHEHAAGAHRRTRPLRLGQGVSVSRRLRQAWAAVSHPGPEDAHSPFEIALRAAAARPK